MIEPPALNTFSRLKSDIQEVESLSAMICELSIAPEGVICEAIERLVELAGTREFTPAFSSLQSIIHRIKWAREGQFGNGYILPWMQIYACLGEGTRLGSLANQMIPSFANPNPQSAHSNTDQSCEHNVLNPYGIGPSPAEINIQEIARLGLRRTKPEYVVQLPQRISSTPSSTRTLSTTPPSLPPCITTPELPAPLQTPTKPRKRKTAHPKHSVTPYSPIAKKTPKNPVVKHGRPGRPPSAATLKKKAAMKLFDELSKGLVVPIDPLAHAASAAGPIETSK